MTKIWQAAQAGYQFSDLVNAAVKGEPQFIARRDGTQVVVVSRDYFEQTKPTLKSVLLTKGYAEDDDDALEAALRSVRSEGAAFVVTRPADGPE
jgi:prevent-host-death family protein